MINFIVADHSTAKSALVRVIPPARPHDQCWIVGCDLDTVQRALWEEFGAHPDFDQYAHAAPAKQRAKVRDLKTVRSNAVIHAAPHELRADLAVHLHMCKCL